MRIGPYQLENNLVLAPMAGVTDQPFRELCKALGAGLVVSEMLSSNPRVWDSEKSRKRMEYGGNEGIRAVQIAGSEPEQMAIAAQHNVENGAQIIDINMGCPAKKVNKKLAGSALLQYPDVVEAIIKAVVNAVPVPVTLKFRTGWDTENKNAVHIAQIAQDNGICSLALHGRTRACLYKGEAEYDTIKAVKQAVSIPVIANGDISSAQKAKFVLEHTQVDGVMIGRAAQGNPWIFREIEHYLHTGELLPAPTLSEVKSTLCSHIGNVHRFYGEYLGVRIARKHVGWYLAGQDPTRSFRKTFNALESTEAQFDALETYFNRRVGDDSGHVSPAA
ncbi:tRNA dihydrouridine synthase DusB [Alteromonas sp. a30]|uniref:tRNA dihydrouridine synthase DusB n=1 Tax=Alteromonas sp. a30 TaxID=2730917 RepID=UPI00227E5F92|nr:tRNA dihydrouridine synthase DusB [Alteromonas sp. a30]MCY7295690.1 tRNA dihydrouridine synthase DusB [Alteromonas sp. a30]